MRVQLESTDKIVELVVGVGARSASVPARIWEGETESGIKVHAFITRIAVHKDDDASQFEAELKEQRSPSRELAGVYPARMIL
jgi:hypothetical protein